MTSYPACLQKENKEDNFTLYSNEIKMEHHKPIDQDDEYDYLFKIVLIGDAGVGKTCIVQRFRSGTFIERHGSTIGVDFTMKTLHLDGKRIKVSTIMSRTKLNDTKNEIYFCLILSHIGERSDHF